MQNDLRWNARVSSVVSKASKRIYHSRASRKADLPKDVGLITFFMKIRPLLEYASPIWGGLPGYLEEDLKRVQDRCLDIIGLPKDTVESLAISCKNFTRKEFKCVLESESHPCRRFITNGAVDHTYNLRSNSMPFSKFTAPASYMNSIQQPFITRGARLNVLE